MGNQDYNVPKNITLTTTKVIDEDVGLGMEDEYTSSGRGIVSGKVDFR